ncbi:hypothetical protein LDENG_00101650 [Lucifuga dentata]|nr:hypothetical protein LDENG_00101650 [Lucifuga dentata]
MPPHHLTSFIIIITVLWIKGVSLSNEKKVFQSPAHVFGKQNDKVTLKFTHHIQNYDTVLWYQRSPGDTTLKLLAYNFYKTPEVEPPFIKHFNVSGDGENTVYLHILKLRHPEDSGEYFGAASITAIKTTEVSYKKLQKDPADFSSAAQNHEDRRIITNLHGVITEFIRMKNKR